MKKILINATQAEEIRVALVDQNQLYDLNIEIPGDLAQNKGNIYKGIINNIRPGLEAAFIDYGHSRQGFIPLKDLYQTYDKVSEKMEVVIQVEKEERGTKGASLTSQISLAGRFLILKPNTDGKNGISRKIEGNERNKLRIVLKELLVPDNMSVIIRTASIGRSLKELQWDLDYLVKLWKSIDRASDKYDSPFLIYQESNIILTSLRDHLREDIDEVIIDEKNVFDTAVNFVETVMPDYTKKLKFYNDSIHLFSRYQIEAQIETAFKRQINLKSGGALVIDHTEAMTTVDVNSGRTKKGKNIEETAFITNREAAEEVARQLRIRDMGGLIVIDFIDMENNSNKLKVEECMQKAIELDRAQIRMNNISIFGLLEMSRQRIRSSLVDSSQTICPRCDGQGRIRDTESLALSILRLIREEALKDNTAQVQAKVPVDIAAFLLNEKREDLAGIEKGLPVKIIIIPNPHMQSPEFKIARIKSNEDKNVKPTFNLIPKADELSINRIVDSKSLKKFNSPAVKTLPRKSFNKRKNIFSRFFSWITRSTPKKKHKTNNYRRKRYYNRKKSNFNKTK